MADDKLKHQATASRVAEQPGDRSERGDVRSDVRRDSAADDFRKDSGLVMTDDEVMAWVRNEFLQEALPRPPVIDGYHLAWLSTTNSYDPIARRIRMGYELVRAEEVPGMQNLRINNGEFAGAISTNEMVLFKIRNELYQRIMRLFHHDLPHEEESKLRYKARDAAEMAGEDSSGRELGVELGDGFENLGKERRAPHFS